MEISSWTGSEFERRRGGEIPPPPSTPPDETARFSIPAGTQVQICRISGDRLLTSHVTRTPLHFERYDSKEHGLYVFRQDGWLITVRPSFVTVRESETERLSHVTTKHRPTSRGPTYPSGRNKSVRQRRNGGRGATHGR